jgi:hypothetical protein
VVTNHKENSVITAIPAAFAAPKTTTPTDFDNLLMDAMKLRGSRNHALDLGVTQEALFRYADGAVFDEGERQAIEHVVARCEWSRSLVVERVKSRRKKRVAA